MSPMNDKRSRISESPAGKRILSVPLTARRAYGMIAAGAILWAAAVFLWLQRVMDKSVQIGHVSLRQYSLVTKTAEAFSTYGLAFCVLIFLCSLVLSFRIESLREARKAYLLILLSFSIAGLAGDLSKEFFVRPRPFLEYAVEIIPITRPPTYSFPSGHTTKSFALVLPFLFFTPSRKRGLKAVKALLLLTAAAVAYSRIVLGVHYLSDILAGIGTAFLFLPLATRMTNAVYTWRRATEDRMGKLAVICGLIMIGLIFYLVHYS